MRGDVYVKEVLRKCEALKEAGLWPAEPSMRPRAWIANFEEADRPLAAVLLDNFTYYPDEFTTRLLRSAYFALADGLKKGPNAPRSSDLVTALDSAVFTRVDGENPRPTDSGNLFCRRARQVLGIPDERFVEPRTALERAAVGAPIVFLDDFVGSGDQFLSTWFRGYRRTEPRSFAEAHNNTAFTTIYITLISTGSGLSRINAGAPNVAVTTAHILDESHTVRGIAENVMYPVPNLKSRLIALLDKYAISLTVPTFLSQDPQWVRFGYKNRGLMFAFEHSVPDATLPLFWAHGPTSWNPLLERS